jgi:hypothetical protein
LREKLGALAACGVDRVVCLNFDEPMSRLGAADFVDDLLVKRLGRAGSSSAGLPLCPQSRGIDCDAA